MNDPIDAAYQQQVDDAKARAGDVSPEAVGRFADQQVARAGAQIAAVRAAQQARAAGAMGGQQTYSAPQAAQLGYNPDTHTVLVNGQPLPHDIAAWHAVATSDPSQLRPMAVDRLQQYGFHPITQQDLATYVAQMQSQATAPIASNAGAGLRSGLRSVGDALGRFDAVTNEWMAKGAHAVGLDAIGNGLEASAHNTRAALAQWQQDQQADDQGTRQGLTLQEQAGNDAGFLQHPGTYLAAKGASFAGNAGPMIAASAINPAVGAGLITAQSAGGSAQDAESRIRAALQNISPQDLAQQSPLYAQLRQQGYDDATAREHLISSAGDNAGAVGGAIGALTTGIYDVGGKGLSAIAPKISAALGGTGDGFVARALTGRGLAGMPVRAAVRGLEGGAVMQGQQMLANSAGAATAGVGSTNPADYFSGKQFAESAVGFGAMGAFTPMHAAAVSDIGAAASAVHGEGVAPTVETPHAPGQGAPGMVSDMFGTNYPSYPNMPAPAADLAQSIDHSQQLPLDYAPPDHNGDLFGPPSQPAGAAPAAPEAAPARPYNPDQTTLPGVPDVGPAQGPRGQLIRQRMLERRQAQAAAPQGEAPALPPLGPTQGMNEHAASLKQSLDLVTNLLANGNFNKRTKSGKATIAQLTAEQARLQGELEAAQNDVVGAEIGAARAQRPQLPGATHIMDPATGQHEIDYGPGHEPGGDPRLTGQELPPGAKPGDSVEPPPLPNPEPMSPQEAAARLAAQRARRPDRQEPQADLFPKQLKAGLQERIAQGAKADDALPVPESTPEPAVDLQAQADDLGKGRDALFVAKGNEAQVPKVRKGVRKVVRDEGTLFTISAAKAKAYREAPTVNDALLARLQGLQEAKGAALAKGDTGVVAAEDAKGAVVKEAVGEANAPAVEAAVPKGGKIVRRSAQAAQERRANLLEQEPKRSRADLVKDQAAAKSAAKAAGKKKIPAEPVTPEELTAKPEVTPDRAAQAHKTLVEDLQQNHPDLLEPHDLAPKAKTGAGRNATPAVARVPLTTREFGLLADRLHATAQMEAEHPQWTPRKSAVRRFLDMMGLPQTNETQLRAVVRDIAGMDPAKLHEMLGRMHARIVDSTLAKGIVRGMDVVRAAVAEQDHDTHGRAGVRESDDPADASGGNLHVRLMDVPAGSKSAQAPKLEPTRSTDRVKIYGDGKDLPHNTADVVGQWLRLLDRHGVAISRIHLMTADDAAHLYGTKRNVAGVSGRLDNGEFYVGVNFSGLPEPAAIEALAHEMGHVTAEAIFHKTAPEDQAAVRRAFEDWLQTSGRGTPTEQMLSRTPPALADLIRQAGVKPERAYAESWHEWIADETAKWFMTSAKPRSAVDRFFAKIADAISKLYAQVEGRGRPTDAVRQMLDNWVERSRDLKGDDAAARALGMDYGRESAEAPRPAEAARARVDARAMTQRFEAVVNGAMNLREQTHAAINGRPEDLRRSINTAITSIGQGKLGRLARKASYAVSNMNDIVGRYGGKEHGEFGRNLTLWDHVMRLAEKHSKEAQQNGQLALERAQRLSAPVSRALEDLMYKSTVYGVHPDAPFATGKNAHLKSEDPEISAANARRYGEVKAMWDQLAGVQGSPQEVYARLRDAMTELHEKTFEARRENIDALNISAEAKEEGHRMLNAAEQRMLEGPYFPLVREGSYITTARMPATRLGTFATHAEAAQAGRRYKAANPHAEIFPVEQVDGEFVAHAGEKAVYFHDTLKDALNAKDAIAEEMREAWAHEGLKLDDAEQTLGPMISEPMTTVDFYRKAEVPTAGGFMAAVNKLHESEHMDPQAYRQLAEMYIESLPETSPRKAFLRRENIRGANRRMLAGYGRRLLGAAHSYGQTMIASERNKAWSGMYKHRGDKPEYGDVMSDLFQRQEILAKRMVHNPLNTMASTVQDASSFLSLAFSPAFALQQALQPLILSAPVLAARVGSDGKAVGYGKTMDALKAAYEGALPFFGKRGGQQWVTELKRALGTYGGDGLTLQESALALIDKFGKTEDERDMLRYMNDRGTLDFSFLNAVNDAVSHTAAGAKAKAIMRLSMAFPQQIEAMNRTVTGLAAYRLAREARGMDHADAVREANAVVSQTHGDYSRYNRPSVFNRPLAGMSLQFKMYTQFMYSLLVSNMAHALDANRSREERIQAVRTLGYVLASHATFGGAVGLGPVAGAAKLALGGLMYAAAGAGLIDKKKKDMTLNDWIVSGTEQAGDEMFGKGAGQELRTAGTYGLPGLLGVDMASKIAIPDLTDTRYTGRARAADQPGDVMDRVLLTMAGSVYSNAKRVANGTGDLFRGDLKGASTQLLPSAPRAWLNAATEAQDGVVTSTGKVVRPKSDMSPYDTAIRVLGLQPVKTAEAYDDRARVQDAIDRIKTGRNELLQQYRSADPEDRAAVLVKIRQFNAGRAPELQISDASLKRANGPAKPSKLETAAAAAVK